MQYLNYSTGRQQADKTKGAVLGISNMSTENHNSKQLTDQFSSWTQSDSLPLAWWLPQTDCDVYLSVANLASSPPSHLLIRNSGITYPILLIPLVLHLRLSCNYCCCR
jgi:hypothetical protein